MTQSTDFCICAIVAQQAIESFQDSRSTKGMIRDSHPWHVATELLTLANSKNRYLPLILAVEETRNFSAWAFIDDIDVINYSGQSYESRCSFHGLRKVNPIFEELSSVVLLPSKEKLHREHVEPIRVIRQHLDEQLIRPYAVCETPAFIHTELAI